MIMRTTFSSKVPTHTLPNPRSVAASMAKAQAIVDYRNQHGPFRAVEDVRKVKGIGEKLFLQIRPELAVSGAPRAAAPAAKADAKPEAKADPKAVPRTGTGAIDRDDKAKK